MFKERQKYLEAVISELEPNIVNHSLALEACMGGIYDYLHGRGELQKELDRDDWLLAGLIHDIDFGAEFKQDHPNKTLEALAKYGIEISGPVHQTILAHGPEFSGVQPQTKAELALFCADSLTGLITAVALVYPTQKLDIVKLSSIMKRFLKQPNFAAGTRRNEVAMCENKDGLSIPLEKFVDICLTSMKAIAEEIGL